MDWPSERNSHVLTERIDLLRSLLGRQLVHVSRIVPKRIREADLTTRNMDELDGTFILDFDGETRLVLSACPELEDALLAWDDIPTQWNFDNSHIVCVDRSVLWSDKLSKALTSLDILFSVVVPYGLLLTFDYTDRVAIVDVDDTLVTKKSTDITTGISRV
jgi:hypothetical protein